MRTITLLILMVVAVIFAVQNADRVAVDVLFWRLDASLAVVIALCVATGVLVGVLITVPRMQMLSHMFKFAIHRGTLENSPVQLLYRPGGKPRRRKRVLSEEELRSFVTNITSICRGSKRKHALMVLLLTMQRRGELARAEWTEFDFDNRRWKIGDGRSPRHTARTSESTRCR